MCYHNHYVEHYALINGYDDEQNVFFTMETDNEKYREFQVTEKQLFDAMSLEETLRYDVVAFEVPHHGSDGTVVGDFDVHVVLSFELRGVEFVIVAE